MKRILATCAALAVVAAISAPQGLAAQTAPTPTGVDCDFWGTTSNPFSPSFTRCLGAYEGNDKHYIDWIEAETGMPYLGSDDGYSGSAPSGWVNPFSSLVPSGTTGQINFSTPLMGSYALVLKASKAFSIYIWEDADALTGVDFIEFATDGTSPRDGLVPGLSHASLFGITRSVPVSVPEPGTLLLLGSGMVGLFGVGYRRSRSDA